MKHKRYIKNYILYPRFQLTIIFTCIASSISTIGVSLIFVFSSFDHFKDIGRALKLKADSQFFRLIDLQQNYLTEKMLIVAFISILLTTIISVWLTHKAVGPIYRLRMYFQNYDQESTKPLKFRKGDFFSDLPAFINKVLKK